MSDNQFTFSIANPHPLGGQQAGMPRYIVTCTHSLTGLQASCASERSQHKNKEIARQMVEYGLMAIGWRSE